MNKPKRLSPQLGLMIIDLVDGSAGTNRVAGHVSQITANTDIDSISAWLGRFTNSPQTLANYRKEAELLVLRASIERQKAVSSLMHEDILAYQQFLTRPPAALLEQASVHWLRHTVGTAMAEGSRDRRYVRDNLGHESLSTTSGYLHSGDYERHCQTGKAPRLSWES